MTKEQLAEQQVIEEKPITAIDRILESLENIGDLPIFSASVNRVQLVSADPNSDAMELAVEILKDANLSSKVLKLANSPFFNRGVAKIGTLSRAIVVLGFDTIKSAVLTMKMVDSFQHEHPAVDMSSLLVKSYMSAGFVRDMAAQCGLKDMEQSYIYGLLHNLGEIITAYTLPEEYLRVQQLAEQEDMKSVQAQKEVLGMTFRKIGQEIVNKWEFPSSVAKTMIPYGFNENGRIKNKVDLNQAIASLTDNMMELLYADEPNTRHSFGKITKEMAKIAGVSTESVANCLDNSFKRSCELAEQFGLDKKMLKPKVNETDDGARDKIAHQLSFYAVSDNQPEQSMEPSSQPSDDGYDDAPQAVEEGAGKVSHASSGDSKVLLSILHEVTTLMTQKAHINSVFHKVLEGMHRGVGFDRVMLVLLTPDHKHYLGRMVVGSDTETLSEFFSMVPVDVDSDLFSKIILEGTELLVPNINEGGWHNMLPQGFIEKVNASSFILAAISVRGHPVGLFYGDKFQSKAPISSEDYRGFMQLVAQAQLALQVH